jgi:hypothetical protein
VEQRGPLEKDGAGKLGRYPFTIVKLSERGADRPPEELVAVMMSV